MFASIIGPISSLAGTWLQGRVDKARAETEVKVARAKAEAKVYETEATSSMLMEQNLTSQMAGSWKDEAWTIFLSQSSRHLSRPTHRIMLKKDLYSLTNTHPHGFIIVYIYLLVHHLVIGLVTGLQIMNQRKK